VLTIITVVLAIAVILQLHDFLEGEHFLADCIDEWRLRRMNLAELDGIWQRSESRSNVIVTLTSTPSRLPFLDLTLKSLLRQSSLPKRIVINIPYFSNREDCVYTLPEWLLCLHSVEIHRCDDLGPATKLLPSLVRFDKRQQLIVVDDDRIYHETLIHNFVRAALKEPDCALGMSGWIVPADLLDRPTTISSNILMRSPAPIRATRLTSSREVDVLQGMSGYLVEPWFFDRSNIVNYGDAPSAARFVDDVWISGHCQVPRHVIAARHTNYPSKLRRSFYKLNSLGLLNRGPGGNELRNNTIVMRHLSRKWRTSRGRTS